MQVLIIEHYRRNGILEGWAPWRVERLAKLLGITIEELGRLCGLFHRSKHSCGRGTKGSGRRRLRVTTNSMMGPLMKQKRMPSWASLHFAYLEAWAVEKLKLKGWKTVKDPMPLNLLATPRSWMESAVEAETG